MSGCMLIKRYSAVAYQTGKREEHTPSKMALNVPPWIA